MISGRKDWAVSTQRVGKDATLTARCNTKLFHVQAGKKKKNESDWAKHRHQLGYRCRDPMNDTPKKKKAQNKNPLGRGTTISEGGASGPKSIGRMRRKLVRHGTPVRRHILARKHQIRRMTECRHQQMHHHQRVHHPRPPHRAFSSRSVLLAILLPVLTRLSSTKPPKNPPPLPTPQIPKPRHETSPTPQIETETKNKVESERATIDAQTQMESRRDAESMHTRYLPSPSMYIHVPDEPWNRARGDAYIAYSVLLSPIWVDIALSSPPETSVQDVRLERRPACIAARETEKEPRHVAPSKQAEENPAPRRELVWTSQSAERLGPPSLCNAKRRHSRTRVRARIPSMQRTRSPYTEAKRNGLDLDLEQTNKREAHASHDIRTRKGFAEGPARELAGEYGGDAPSATQRACRDARKGPSPTNTRCVRGASVSAEGKMERSGVGVDERGRRDPGARRRRMRPSRFRGQQHGTDSWTHIRLERKHISHNPDPQRIGGQRQQRVSFTRIHRGQSEPSLYSSGG
ncbi:hypothetical protein K438DRAFT_1784429 [Mycena galopus ATCC 62051]|nr:hypothetical protein K438DRAFT_1784429 [Mycena galopus ATCC 62051]